MIQPILVRNGTRCLSQNSTLIICRHSHSRKTHYDTLNLKSNCTNDEIRHAFAKLSKEHHPDTSKAKNTENSSRKFQEIMDAYRILKKKTSREAYDAEIFNRHAPGRNQTANYHHTYRGADYEMIRRHMAGEYHRTGPYGQYGPYGPNSNGSYSQRDPYARYQRDPFNVWNEKQQYDAWNSNPFLLLNRKRTFIFIIGFVFLNFMSVLFTYSVTSRNRVALNDTIRDSYGRHRIGAHAPTYSGASYSKAYSQREAEDDPVVK